jgi:hypothetical protein
MIILDIVFEFPKFLIVNIYCYLVCMMRLFEIEAYYTTTIKAKISCG